MFFFKQIFFEEVLKTKSFHFWYIYDLLKLYLFMYNDIFLKLKSLNIAVYVIVVALLSYLISILCAFIFEKLKKLL